MAQSFKGLLLNWLLLIFTVLLTLCTAEIITRICWIDSYKDIKHHHIFCEHDPVLGWRKIPNAIGKHISNEFSVVEHFNSKGIRGPEYAYDKRDNEYRIMILGDSFAEGYAVQFRELFSEVLKTELNANRKNNRFYQVINCGTAGWSTDQELLFFQHEGKKYSPDLTILMFFVNDLWFNKQARYEHEYKPLFRLEKNNLYLTNTPVPKPERNTGVRQDVEEQLTLYEKLKRWLNQKLYLYRFVTTRIKNWHYLYTLAIRYGLAAEPEMGNEKSAQVLDKRSHLTSPSLKCWYRHNTDDIDNAWKLTEALILKLKKECSSVGSRLLVFYIPAKVGIYEEVWHDTKKKYGLSDEDWDIQQVGRKLQSLCRKHNIDCIEPTNLFSIQARKLKKERKMLYFLRDCHWNIEGNDFTGKLLATYITSKYLSNDE